MPVDKLAPQMQLNCIITPIDFVLTFKMYRYLVASLSKEDNESQSPFHFQKTGKSISRDLTKTQCSKCNFYLFIDAYRMTSL